MAKEKVVMDYKHLNIEKMVDYVVNTEGAKEKIDLKSFYEERAKKTAVGVFDAEGKPVMYVAKGGKLQQKKKMVETSGKKTKVYNILKAKRAFYDAFKDDIDWGDTAPKKKAEKEKKDVVKDALSRL